MMYLTIPTETMILIFKLMICIFILSVLYYSFIDFEQDSIIDNINMCLKIAGYGLLAFFIYKYSKENSTMDVLTFFTYMLACFETVHNLCNVLGKWLASCFKLITGKF